MVELQQTVDELKKTHETNAKTIAMLEDKTAETTEKLKICKESLQAREIELRDMSNKQEELLREFVSPFLFFRSKRSLRRLFSVSHITSTNFPNC